MTGEVYRADVAVHGSRVAAVGDVERHVGPETEVIDARGLYLVPGLIDGHIHCEVTKLSMTMFARLVLPRGTTSIVTALDQIAGVAGLPGVRRFLKEAAGTPLKVHYGMPSKLPYTVPSSTLAHTFGPREAAVAAGWGETVGVWETGPETVLGAPDGGTGPDGEVIETIRIAERARLQTYGSAPLLRGDRLSGFVCAGIRSDHESYTAEESLEKLRDGLYLMIRESSVVRFLEENIRVVTERGVDPRRVAFCTDDVTASDVLARGHLDRMVREAIRCGVDPVSAIQMATLNCAELYRIDHEVGCIAPGR
ncbi:MAG: amidohydrolase family protein, partial [Nitrososphaerales archaeon]